MIISLEGPRAVGKTTLTNKIKQCNKNIIVCEGFYLPNTPKNFVDMNEFCANQELYIEQKIQQYKNMDENSNYLIVRGSEGIIQYTLTYPYINGYDWNVKDKLSSQLDELGKYRSDIVLYLNASLEKLEQRNEHDNEKFRDNYKNNLKKYWRVQKESFEQYQNVIFLDTDNMTAEEVYKYTLDLFKGE